MADYLYSNLPVHVRHLPDSSVETDANGIKHEVELPGFEQSGANVHAQIPSNRAVLPPGYYYVFAVSQSGTPSVATIVQITDPRRPRYAIDRDPDGLDTLFGTTSRNLEEELRAMKDGLAPGQVRPGLRLLARVLESMEGFCRLIGQELFLIEPLFYHSAILYERRGCGYLLGRDVMEEIHASFGEGGALRAALDDSSPFRRRGAEWSVRGRSWALHDGVAGAAWGGVKMYKAAGRHAGMDTFPGGRY